MRDGNTVWSRRRPRLAGTIGMIVLALGLAACSGSNDAGGGGGGAAPTQAPPTTTTDPVAINVTPSGLNPTDPLEVKADKGTINSVTVTNPKGSAVKGVLAPDKLSWKSSEVLGYDADYKVVVAAADKDGKVTEKTETVHTLVPKAEVYPSLVPYPTAQLPSVGVGQPIVVRFNHPIQDKAAVEKALSVKSSPNQPGSWYWMSKTEVHYRAQNYWAPGTTINLHMGLYGLDTGGGVYGETDRDITIHVHDAWVAKADGNTEQMTIFRNGVQVNSMPVSMGKDKTPTHMGTHVISDKQTPYVMDSCTYGVCPGNPDYYHSTEFFAERISNDGEFVHENPNSVGSQGNANVSHGCINLNAQNAEWFFNNFGLGDVVEVTNSGGPALPVWDTYGDWAISWNQWQTGSALR